MASMRRSMARANARKQWNKHGAKDNSFRWTWLAFKKRLAKRRKAA